MNKDYSLSADAEVWQQFINGDKEALSFIYQRHYKPLVKYGHKLSPDDELVEDCIQDLFLELWKNKTGLSHTDSIRFYLLKSLRRKIFRAAQKKHKGTEVDLQADDFPFMVEYSIEDVWITESESAQLKHKLMLALSQLTSRQKEAIYLKFYNDMDYDEIAAIMNISYQSIRTLVYLAIKVLRDHISLQLTVLSALLTKAFFN